MLEKAVVKYVAVVSEKYKDLPEKERARAIRHDAIYTSKPIPKGVMKPVSRTISYSGEIKEYITYAIELKDILTPEEIKAIEERAHQKYLELKEQLEETKPKLFTSFSSTTADGYYKS